MADETPDSTPPRRRRLKPLSAEARAPRTSLEMPEAPQGVDADASAAPGAPVAPQTPAQLEAAHRANAESSPLAMTFQLIGCSFASMNYEDDKVIPTYTFHPPCIRGYDRPNQECRTCAYVRIMPVGERESFKHRYHGHGMVVPINEEQADAVFATALEQGAQPLANPEWNAYFERLKAEADAQRAREEQRRQMEEQQRGQFARRSNVTGQL